MYEPRMIGHYRIVELLGSGAMGTVHVAVDTFIERAVAIKSHRAELTRDPDFVSRFRAVEPAPANSAKKLREFIEVYGPSVRCRRAPPRGKYFCDVGPSPMNLAAQVLREHSAKPTADTPAEMSRN
jgi:serine/threonine protein kinase